MDDLRSAFLLLGLSAVLAATPPAAGAAPQKAAAPVAEPQLKDRVMAVADVAFRRRILNDLIEQRLRFHEIDRFGFEQVPVDLIEKNVAEIRARFPSEEAFRKTLQDLGLTYQALRQLVAQQLLVLTHVEEQLG